METLTTIKQRTSIRKFETRQISKKDLHIILSAGGRAPIGYSKYDEMHIIVIQDKEVLTKLDNKAKKYWNKPYMTMFMNAPTGIIIAGKPTNYYGMEYDNGACVAENMLLAIHDLGLGGVYLKGIVEYYVENPKEWKKFKLPDGFIPLAGIALGHPKKDVKVTPKDHFIEYTVI